jgi:hypothetical protein
MTDKHLSTSKRPVSDHFGGVTEMVQIGFHPHLDIGKSTNLATKELGDE